MSDTHDSLVPAESDETNASPAQGQRSTTTFATFNVLHGRRPKSYVDLDGYAQAVADLNADLVGLQEVDKGMLRSWRADMTDLAASRAGAAGHFGKAIRRWDTGLYGNALVTRGEISQMETLRLPRHSWRNERRAAIAGTVSLNGLRWEVGVTHLSLDLRESQAQLRFLLEFLGDRPAPTVLLGDFNRRPQDVEPLAERFGWTVASTSATYPSWGPEQRIDFVLFRGARQVSSDVRSMPVSDHCAVVVELAAL